MIKIFLIKEGIGMEFREIVTFLQAAKLQSFSKAARQLGYSQAAVTIQIKQLEQELGVHLFDRIGVVSRRVEYDDPLLAACIDGNIVHARPRSCDGQQFWISR